MFSKKILVQAKSSSSCTRADGNFEYSIMSVTDTYFPRKKLDNAYRFVKPVFDIKKQKYNICWADFVLLLEDTVITKVYLTEAV